MSSESCWFGRQPKDDVTTSFFIESFTGECSQPENVCENENALRALEIQQDAGFIDPVDGYSEISEERPPSTSSNNQVDDTRADSPSTP